MAILSKRLMATVNRAFHERHGRRVRFWDLSGRLVQGADVLADQAPVMRQRHYAWQESCTRGEPCVYEPVPGLLSFAVALEDCRRVYGALLGPEALCVQENGTERVCAQLATGGMPAKTARRYLAGLPRWSAAQVRAAALEAQDLFYRASGWTPELMRENRLKALQTAQLHQAIEDQRKNGQSALYAFEKERELLTRIRAGDAPGARRMLNEMLASIYMSSPRLPVLRARVIELTSCLTRAAIEDNLLLEPLIECNHAWTERLIEADSLEDMSRALTLALDEFMEGVYLQGMNRSNKHVQKAMEHIGRHFGQHIALDSLAARLGLSSGRLAHLIKDYTGRTFVQILHEVRVRHAQKLLLHTSKSCTDIAYETGFSDQSYFIRIFRRLTGTTPLRYRRAPSTPRPS